MKILVVGLGYVGITTALYFADKGYEVLCLDKDNDKIKKIQNGESPIYEPCVEELIKKNKTNIITNISKKEAYHQADVIFITVGTPQDEKGNANLSFIYDVIKDVIEFVNKDCTIVIKSTVPVGTCDNIEKIIKTNLNRNINIDIVSNPEFLAQGNAINDTFNPSRIIIGTENDRSKNVMSELYKGTNSEKVFMDRRSSELVKYASNCFLALKLSYINEIANISELLGVNIENVVKGMSYDSRIGKEFLKCGVGFGGSCFPKDTNALINISKNVGYNSELLNSIITSNEKQRLILLNKAKKIFESFKNKKIAILGLAFKPNTDDIRESPALKNIKYLVDEEANIYAYDPKAMENCKKIYPNLNYCINIEDAIKDADLCMIFTEWNEIKKFQCNKYKELMKNPIVLDGRNCYDVAEMERIGIRYDSIGRKRN